MLHNSFTIPCMFPPLHTASLWSDSTPTGVSMKYSLLMYKAANHRDIIVYSLLLETLYVLYFSLSVTCYVPLRKGLLILLKVGTLLLLLTIILKKPSPSASFNFLLVYRWGTL